jgi:WD40 repeat protein
VKRLILLCLTLLTTINVHAQTDLDVSPTPQQIMQLGRGTANTLDWHPDGYVMAVGGNLGIWLYDDNLADLAHFEEVGDVLQLAWSPNGEMLATFNRDGTLQVWSVALAPYRLTFHKSRSFKPDDYVILDSAWSPDSQKLAVTVKTGGQILDVMTSETLVVIPELIYAVTWNLDGTQIAGMVDLGDEMGYQVRVWNAANGELVNTYTSSDPNLFWSDIEWSPDGSILVGLTSLPATLHAWNVTTGELLNDVNFSADLSAYFDMWWVNEGQQLVTVSRYVTPPGGSTLQVWDTTTWAEVDRKYRPGDDFRDIAKHPNAEEWGLLTWDGQIMTWGLQASEPLQTRSVYSQPARLLAWSPDNHNLATAGYSSASIDIWDVATIPQPEAQRAIDPLRGWEVDGLRWSENSDTLIGILSIPQITAPGAYPTAFIVQWDAQTGEYIGTIHETPGYVAHDDSENYLTHYIWSDDFTRVVTEMSEQPLTISTVGTESDFFSPDEEITTIDSVDYPSKIIWSPDNTMLAIITRDPQGETSAWVYDAETGKLVNRLRPTFFTTLYDLTWSPDSTMVAIAGSRGIAGSGETEYRLDVLEVDPSSNEAAHITTVLDANTTFYHAWHPESHAIAVTTSQGIGIYPIESSLIGVDATPIATILDVRAFALAWSSDGRWLAGGHEDGTVRVWDVTRENR